MLAEDLRLAGVSVFSEAGRLGAAAGFGLVEADVTGRSAEAFASATDSLVSTEGGSSADIGVAAADGMAASSTGPDLSFNRFKPSRTATRTNAASIPT
jgi:hypothetical protein